MLEEHAEIGWKYGNGDHWDLGEMQRDWLQFFTCISYEHAVDVAETILSHAPTQSAILRFNESVARNNTLKQKDAVLERKEIHK